MNLFVPLKLTVSIVVLMRSIGCKGSNKSTRFSTSAKPFEGCDEWVSVGQVMGKESDCYCKDLTKRTHILGSENLEVKDRAMNDVAEMKGNSKIVAYFPYLFRCRSSHLCVRSN